MATVGIHLECKVTGLQELSLALRGVDDKVRNKALRKAAVQAAKPITKEMKARCPVSTEPLNPHKGLLKKSIGTKVKMYKGAGVVVVMIGPRQGFRMQVGTRTRGRRKGQPFFQDPTKIAHLVEFGTRHSAAKPFLRPAYDHNKQQAEATFARVIKEELGL